VSDLITHTKELPLNTFIGSNKKEGGKEGFGRRGEAPTTNATIQEEGRQHQPQSNQLNQLNTNQPIKFQPINPTNPIN
jgi:hypothetical protein